MVVDEDGEIHVAIGEGNLAAHYVLANALRRDSHAHDEYQLFIPLASRHLQVRFESGAGSVRSAKHSPGSVHFVDARQPHAFTWDRLEMVSLFWSGALLERIGKDVLGRTFGVSDMYGFDDALIPRLGFALRDHLVEHERPSRIFVESLTIVAATRVVEKIAGPSSIRSYANVGDRRLRLACEFIEVHLGDELRLEKIAEIAGLSPFHFLRAFRTAFGTTPHRYIVERRLERAREHLVASRKTVLAISEDLGFASPSHLAAAFKRRFGVNPSEYRATFGLPITMS